MRIVMGEWGLEKYFKRSMIIVEGFSSLLKEVENDKPLSWADREVRRAHAPS
jgi:hypothetical protein